MEKDCKICRAIFIDRSVEVRDQLHYGNPKEVLKAINVYCYDGYGAMLWRLDSHASEMYFKAWNTALKLIHKVPRNTFTYLTKGYLSGKDKSLRYQVLGRFPGFLQSLYSSPSKEVRFLSRVVTADPSSTTRCNIKYIKKLTCRSPAQYSSSVIKQLLPQRPVPPEEEWRLGLLSSVLSLRKEKTSTLADTEQVEAMIASLCST